MSLAFFLFHLKVSAVSLSFLLFFFFPSLLYALVKCQEEIASPEMPAQLLNKIKMDRTL